MSSGLKRRSEKCSRMRTTRVSGTWSGG
jgi:hypothetical protein